MVGTPRQRIKDQLGLIAGVIFPPTRSCLKQLHQIRRAGRVVAIMSQLIPWKTIPTLGNRVRKYGIKTQNRTNRSKLITHIKGVMLH